MDLMMRRKVLLASEIGNLININDNPVVYVSSGGTVYNKYSIADGVITLEGATNIAWLTKCKQGKSYTYSLNTSYTGGTRMELRVYCFDEPVTQLGPNSVVYARKSVSNTTDEITFSVPVDADFVYVGFYCVAQLAGNTISDISVKQS